MDGGADLMPTRNTWNIMYRRSHEPHFSPFYTMGVDEDYAREMFVVYTNDPSFGIYEMQLVHEYAWHHEMVDVLTATGADVTRKLVVDGWKAVT